MFTHPIALSMASDYTHTRVYTPLRRTLTLERVVCVGALISVAALIGGCSSNDPEIETSSSPRETHTDIALETHEREVIYGEDTRRDLYQVDEPALATLARTSIMAMVSEGNVNVSSDGAVTLRGGTLQDRYQLCEGQRYRDQITASSCSATLIDDDVIVTAGHCVESQAECETKRFVLGYHMESESDLAPLTAGDVFSCQQLILSVNTNALDYAFIKLDRPVDAMRGTPAPVVQNSDPLELNEPLVMMGFPSGLPLKVDSGGFVSDPRGGSSLLNYFRATVDAFGGNSGSGVFNEAGEQVGILVRGETDYAPSPQGCTVVNELSIDRGPGDDAEELTYLSRALSALCDSGYPSERLCGQSLRGLCLACDVDADCLAGYRCGRFDRYPDAPTFCAPGCDDDSPCPEGHVCLSGQCTPTETRDCEGDQVIAIDSCQRRLGTVESCGEGQYCRRGACLEASTGNLCESALIVDPVDQEIRGSFTEGFTSSSFGSCSGEGPEVFYQFTLDAPDRMIATARGLDTVLYLRSSCDPMDELACVDDSRPPGRYGSRIDTPLDAGTYYLALDTYSSDERGDFRLEFDFCDAICTPGEYRCITEGEAALEICTRNDDGCFNWAPADQCEGGRVCREGQCVGAPPVDTCTSARRIEQSRVDEAWSWAESWVETNTLALGSRCTPDARVDGLYQITLTSSSILSATLRAEAGVGLALYEGCPSSNIARAELTCDAPQEGVSALTATLAPGEYTLVALGAAPDEYQVTLELEPVCMDQCDVTLEPYCTELEGESGLEDAVLACQVNPEDGCAALAVLERCGESSCAGGICQRECFDECNIGTRECADLSSPLECIADERGCAVWSRLESCLAGELCSGEGRCVEDGSDWGVLDTGVGPIDVMVSEEDAIVLPSPPPSDWVGYEGPREIVLNSRSRGGCDLSPRGHDERGRSSEFPLSPLTLSLFGVLMGLKIIRRRDALVEVGSARRDGG